MRYESGILLLEIAYRDRLGPAASSRSLINDSCGISTVTEILIGDGRVRRSISHCGLLEEVLGREIKLSARPWVSHPGRIFTVRFTHEDIIYRSLDAEAARRSMSAFIVSGEFPTYRNKAPDAGTIAVMMNSETSDHNIAVDCGVPWCSPRSLLEIFVP
ncbi:hypothetical protein BDN71DRAFT_229125 [Pleurotus eryngii]|uniref:Uncharacterized protein n=1 Tax=Pleurotus eryngii TaxID=5323 RepID=A0A9P6A8V5_PLEER|nr:hypothetical protein BDN71DRAFT_229125 [Pleurotus eryngii]